MKIQRKTCRAEVPALAMGDIAFNLLIFFVILAQAQDDSFLTWQPAKAANLENAGPSRVSILIDTEDRLYLNGQEIGVGQLADRIRLVLGDAPPGERNVLLKVDRETTAVRFEPVIEAISEAGGDMVHILEEER
jgi:biopolymer transport protein ExbD